ncbi:MAG: hypothetical protein WA628_16075 [Terriglobales bacterium]
MMKDSEFAIALKGLGFSQTVNAVKSVAASAAEVRSEASNHIFSKLLSQDRRRRTARRLEIA